VSGGGSDGGEELNVGGFDAGGDDSGGSPSATEGGAGGAPGCEEATVGEDIVVPNDYATIQDAIDAADEGQTVMVKPGTYFERIDFVGKAIRLVSQNGPTQTTIDGQKQGTVVTFESGEGRSSLLEGFTIRNGYDAEAGGMMIATASPTVRRNVFLSNVVAVGGQGAAIYGNGASPLVTRNYFSNNTCDSQFGVGTVSLVNDSTPVVVDNVFINNDCPGVAITISGHMAVEVSNNTFVNNREGVYLLSSGPSSVHVYRNNLIIGGEIGLEVSFYGDEVPHWSHNLVFGNAKNYSGTPDWTGVSGNLSVDPGLADVEAGDTHLLAGSPAIDVGDAGLGPLQKWDFDGGERVRDGNGDHFPAVDIGADEYTSAQDCR
jgi:hypothetical protein